MNETVVESALSMLFYSNMSNEFWAEAVNTAVYLRNHTLESLLMNICLVKKPGVANLV